MKIVVIGATGTIGSAVAEACAERGHEVIRASRGSEPAIDIEDPASIDAFYDAVGEVDAVICCAGGGAFAALSELDDDQLQHTLDSKARGQINVVRKGLDATKTFILTGGMLAYSPWPGTAAVAFVNAGLEGFVRAASLDLGDDGHIAVVHPPLVRETAEKMGMDAEPWPDAATTAEAYIAALKADAKGQPVFVEGYAPEG